MLWGEQIFRLSREKYFILNTNEIVTVSLKYRFWVRVWPERESLYFTLTEALVRKISTRARVFAKASLIEPSKKREEREKDDCSDSGLRYSPSVITVF